MRTRHLTVRLPIWIDSLKESSEFPSNLKHSVVSIVSALSVVVLDRSKVILVVIMNGSPVTYPDVEVVIWHRSAEDQWAKSYHWRY